jgi:hypothetical protein
VLRYIEKCPNINFSEIFSDTKHMSKPPAIFQRSIDVQDYIASANVTNFKLPKSGPHIVP